jgi:hypothetical protein
LGFSLVDLEKPKQIVFIQYWWDEADARPGPRGPGHSVVFMVDAGFMVARASW